MKKLNLQQFAAPGLTTGLRKATFENLQLNAGVMLVNFDYDDITTTAALKTAVTSAITGGESLGATRGGGTFNVTKDIRTVEVDGKRYDFKGDKFVDSADTYLTTTLLEITAENLKRALSTGEIETTGEKTTIKMHTAIGDSDYLQNIVWVGDTSNAGFVMIVLYNALNTADLTLTFTDKGEGTLPVEFHASQDEVDDNDYAPFEIIKFTPA